MTLQWTLISNFLYIEMAVVVLLLFPLISAQRWSKLFKSSFFRGLGQQVNFYFYVTIVFLILFLFDAYRNMTKYGNTFDDKSQPPPSLQQELRNSRALFKAQRNFYMTGFSLFLIFVIRRLMTLLAVQASLEASSEAAMRQATSASKAAEELMSQNDKSTSDENIINEAEEKISQLKEELADAKKTSTQAVKDLEAFKSQSEGVAREYDRLSEEHSKLQEKMAILDGEGGSDKKDD